MAATRHIILIQLPPVLCHTRLLASVYLQEDYFDLVDVDSFGSDTSYLAAAIDALKYGGLLYLTSTDGMSAGGEAFRSVLYYSRAQPFAEALDMDTGH